MPLLPLAQAQRAHGDGIIPSLLSPSVAIPIICKAILGHIRCYQQLSNDASPQSMVLLMDIHDKTNRCSIAIGCTEANY